MYYKVVSKSLGNLLSAVTDDLPDKYVIKYEIGKWVEPKIKGSKIFVFNNREVAFEFTKNSKSWFVYECEVDGIYKGKYKLFVPSWNHEQIDNLWYNFSRKKKFTNILHGGQDFLNHTVWVSKVKLTNHVY